MSRMAATTNGRPWSCSGLSAISTITSLPSLALRHQFHLRAHRPRHRGAGRRPGGTSAWRGRMPVGHQRVDVQAGQLVDRRSRAASAAAGLAQHDAALGVDHAAARRGRPRTARGRRPARPARRQRAAAPRDSAHRLSRGHRRHQDVAGAAHRLDDLRIFGVGLELLAQPADLHVDGAVEGRRPRGRASARAGSRATARGPGAARSAHSRSNSPLVSATSWPCGSRQAARGQVEHPAGEAQRSRARAGAAGGAAGVGAAPGAAARP